MTHHRFIDAGQHAQQRGFSRAIAADQPQPVAAAQAQIDVAEGPHDNTLLLVLCQPARSRGHDHLLQAAGAAVIQRKQDRDVFHLNQRCDAHDLDPERDATACLYEECPR